MQRTCTSFVLELDRFLLSMTEHYENTDYAYGTSYSAIQRDPALEGQDIVSQGSELTGSAQMQRELAGAESPSNVTMLLPDLSSSARCCLAQCRHIPGINLQPHIN